jgi:hypothetical protein
VFASNLTCSSLLMPAAPGKQSEVCISIQN